MDFETAQLVVPLTEFVTRWSLYRCHEKSAALTYFKKTAGFEPHELAAIEAFLIALDNPEDEEDED